MIPLLVTGTVLSIQVELPPARLPRTHVALERDDGVVIDVVLPGANGGAPVAVGGVPVLKLGETWQLELVDAPVGLVPLGLGAGMSRLDGPTPPPWAVNGIHYDTDQLPFVFYLNQAGSADLGFALTEEVVQRALGAWTEVGCSTFSFEYGGTTDQGYADDGINVLSWEDGDTWEWGDANIAGLTATRFEATDDGGIRAAGADIVFNGVEWTWLDGEGLPNQSTLDAGSIIMHELGHVAGMDHEQHLMSSTMFFAYQGGAWMGSLAGDDRRGICEIYPSGTDECDSDADCVGIDDQDRVCVDIDGIKVCDEVRDDVGAPCSAASFNCPEYCVFQYALDTQGTCSIGCETDADCPADHVCGTASNFVYDQPTVDETLCVPGQRPDTGLAPGGDDSGPVPDPATGAADTGSGTAMGCGCTASARPSSTLWLCCLPLFALRRRVSANRADDPHSQGEHT